MLLRNIISWSSQGLWKLLFNSRNNFLSSSSTLITLITVITVITVITLISYPDYPD